MALTGGITKPAGGGGGKFEDAPKGVHVSRLVRIVDQGTQKKVYNGDEKEQHKVWLMFELPNVPREFEDKDGNPQRACAVVSEFYTLSMYRNARLRQFTTSWTGEAMSDTEADAYDIGQLLDTVGMLAIVHEPKEKSDGVWVNISSAMPLPDGMPMPERVHPLVYLELTPEGYDPEVFAGLSTRMQDTIKQSPEWQLVANLPPVGSQRPQATADDDVPLHASDGPPPEQDLF